MRVHKVLTMRRASIRVGDMSQTSSLLASAEVCERLGIDRSTLSRWVAAGRIMPAYKSPGTRGPFLFDASEVERVKREQSAA
jgi:excisionase family DNA binding protein